MTVQIYYSTEQFHCFMNFIWTLWYSLICGHVKFHLSVVYILRKYTRKRWHKCRYILFAVHLGWENIRNVPRSWTINYFTKLWFILIFSFMGANALLTYFECEFLCGSDVWIYDVFELYRACSMEIFRRMFLHENIGSYLNKWFCLMKRVHENYFCFFFVRIICQWSFRQFFVEVS